SNTTVFPPGRWQSGWFLQRRLSECRCIPESRTHGTTSWWTCCVSNLNRIIDPTTDWASTSTFFKACTLPPDEPKLSCAETWREIRNTMRDYRHPVESGERLRQRLKSAVTDDYIRKDKTSRNY